jgi:hypothetical protein
MQLKKREAEILFSKLQFVIKTSHHKSAVLYYEGRAILRTRISHGQGDIPPVVVAKMRNQLKVTEAQLRELIACSMSYEDYIAVLKAKGIIA